MTENSVVTVADEPIPTRLRHYCNWPKCQRVVPVALFACNTHWRKLPDALRRLIWRTYPVGAEAVAAPSAEYLAAERVVLAWIAGRQCAETGRVRRPTGTQEEKRTSGDPGGKEAAS